MVTWANYLSFLIVLAAAIGGFAGASSAKASAAAVAFFTLGGLVAGVVLAWACSRLQSWALRTKRLTPGEAMGIYAMTPVLSLLLALIGTVWLASRLAKLIL